MLLLLCESCVQEDSVQCTSEISVVLAKQEAFLDVLLGVLINNFEVYGFVLGN